MDLRRLGHLVALADERHFAHAALQVHLSQPAFSRSIRALERDRGQQLFERETRDVRPAPARAFLIERARRLLFDAHFKAGPLPAATLMPKVLPELRRLPLAEAWACGVALTQMPAVMKATLGALLKLPPLYSELGVVSLCNRSPSPMARLVMQLIGDVAARVNATPAPAVAVRSRVRSAQRGTGRG